MDLHITISTQKALQTNGTFKECQISSIVLDDTIQEVMSKESLNSKKIK